MATDSGRSPTGFYRTLIVIQMLLLLGLLGWLWKMQRDVDLLRKAPTGSLTGQLVPESHRAAAQPATPILSYSTAVKAAAPAVVNIYTTQKVKLDRRSEMLRELFGGGPHPQEDASSLGSGVIVRADGYILTNNHVINGADGIVVALHDGRKAKARVIGTDPDSDLAVIKVDLTGLPALTLNPTTPQVGDVVLAIGNPFGVGQTVTHGIVSATRRSGLGINAFEDFIQTDAPINPGNSGGALVNMAGQLIGINTAIYSRSGGSMGIGFAIPTGLAQTALTQIIQHGKVTRGWLGVEVKGQSDNPAEMIEPDQAGVLVAGVVQDGPAASGGMRPMDVIVRINGQPITDASRLIQYVAQQRPGTLLPMTVRRDSQLVELTIRIGERPSSAMPHEGEREEGYPHGQLPDGERGSGLPDMLEQLFRERMER